MTEHAEEIQEREMMTMGMAFMGFLMGVGSLLGIWFLSGLLQVMSKMMGQIFSHIVAYWANEGDVQKRGGFFE